MNETDTFRLIPLASSSKANATAIETRQGAERTVVVVDCGISRKETLAALSDALALDSDKPKPDALLLTHEHGDHAKFAHQWLELQVPILATRGTAAMLGLDKFACWREAITWHPHHIGRLCCTSMGVAHDAIEPCAWRVTAKNGAAIVATDWAEIPPGFRAFVQGATAMLLEANYHPDLLHACHYIPALKARIEGDLGHMSLVKLCDWLGESLPDTVTDLYLGHISTIACHPEIVRHLARQALTGRAGVNLHVLEK